MRRFLLLAPFLLATPALAEAPRVVATTKPIHSLVAAVMGETGAPALIVKGAASPHTYSLRPSDAAELEAADVVFWTGHGMELFLEDSIATLAPNATVVELSDAPGIELLPVREGGAFEAHAHGDEAHAHDDDHEDHAHEHEDHDDDEHAHDHEHEAHEHDHEDADHAHDEDGHADADEHEHDDHAHEHGEMDMHFWLDPVNAAHMLDAIAEALAEADPEQAATYRANAGAEAARLDALTEEVAAELAPVRDRPFIVFHDAYQYFERRFGLSVAGSLTVTPDSAPGAQRVAELRDKVLNAGAVCVFAEPQFEPAIVQTIIEGTEARSGTLDPEAAGLAEGPALYGELIRGLAASLLDCLGGE